MDLLSDAEVAEREEALERVELFDRGYFDPDPNPERQYVPCDLCQTPVINVGPECAPLDR